MTSPAWWRKLLLWFAAWRFDLIFWGCVAMTLGNLLQAVLGPSEMMSKFFIASLVFAGAAALIYLGEEQQDEG